MGRPTNNPALHHAISIPPINPNTQHTQNSPVVPHVPENRVRQIPHPDELRRPEATRGFYHVVTVGLKVGIFGNWYVNISSSYSDANDPIGQNMAAMLKDMN